MDASCVNYFEANPDGKKMVNPYLCKVEECEPSIEDNLLIYGSHLPKETPAVFYMGGRPETLWTALERSNTKLISLPLEQQAVSHVDFYELARRALCYVFDNATTGGVYCVGHGVGALLVAELLADREALCERARLWRLRAAFLVAGLYDDLAEPVVDYAHLWHAGTRLYVIAAGRDPAELRARSRRAYDRLAACCDMCDMHYEVKEHADGRELLAQMSRPDGFLARLLRYDVALSQTR